MAQFPSTIKELTLSFTQDKLYDDVGLVTVPWTSEDMMAFLQLFPSLTTFHLEEALVLPPPLLVCALLF